jgi:hypothetical protein
MTELELHPRKDERAEKSRPMNAVKEAKAPFFFYRNFSGLSDPDPSKPVTASGRIPNFPAKMMAILSRPDLAHIISWMPHGRSWKVHKPREFECKVIPTYFEHSKFSSFIRQANGWGFRRMISKGPDRNSYYHELFLRGNPHLIKLMKRPTSTTRPQGDAATEPDFYRISDEHPVPEAKVEDEVQFEDQEANGETKRYSVDNFVQQDTVSSMHSYDHTPMEPYSVYHYPSRPHYHTPLPVESSHSPMTLPPVYSSMEPVARAVSPVLSHIPYPKVPPSLIPVFVPENQWTETCLEPRVMPFDFEDPFAGGLTPVDFW